MSLDLVEPVVRSCVEILLESSAAAEDNCSAAAKNPDAGQAPLRFPLPDWGFGGDRNPDFRSLLESSSSSDRLRGVDSDDDVSQPSFLWVLLEAPDELRLKLRPGRSETDVGSRVGVTLRTAIDSSLSSSITSTILLWSFKRRGASASCRYNREGKMRPVLMKGHERPLTFLRYNREGDLIFSCAKGHNGAVWSCDVSKDSMRLITGSADLTLKLWNVQTGAQLFTFNFDSPARSVQFSVGDKLEKDLTLSPEKAAELKHIIAVLDDLSPEELGEQQDAHFKKEEEMSKAHLVNKFIAFRIK